MGPEAPIASGVDETKQKAPWRGAIRAALCVIVPIAVPPLLGMLYYLTVGINIDGDDPGFLDVYSFIAVWGWSVWVYPHVWVYVRTETGLTELSYPFLWAVIQWAIVVSLFVLAARKWRLRWQIAGAVGAIFIVCCVTQWVLNIPPFEMQIDGP